MTGLYNLSYRKRKKKGTRTFNFRIIMQFLIFMFFFMLLNIVKKAVVNWQNLNSVIHSSLSNLSGHRALVIITRILSSTNEVTTDMKMRLTDRNHKLISNSEIMSKNQTYRRPREKPSRFVTKRLIRHFLGIHAMDPM